MGNENITLYIDRDKYNKLSDNYKVSRLANIMMDSYLSDETQDITLTLQLNQIVAAREQLEETKRSAEKVIAETITQIAFLDDRERRLKEDFQHAKELRVRNEYYNQFNGICINCDFDLDKVLERGAVLIAKIKLVDPTFDPKARMERYKILIDDY